MYYGATSNELLKSSIAVALDQTFKYQGKLIFEKQLSEYSKFFVTSFENDLKLNAWEFTTRSLIKAEFLDILFCKMLCIKDANLNEIFTTRQKIKDSIGVYSGAILKEFDNSMSSEYRLLLLFTNEFKMKSWEEQFLIQ